MSQRISTQTYQEKATDISEQILDTFPGGNTGLTLTGGLAGAATGFFLVKPAVGLAAGATAGASAAIAIGAVLGYTSAAYINADPVNLFLYGIQDSFPMNLPIMGAFVGAFIGGYVGFIAELEPTTNSLSALAGGSAGCIALPLMVYTLPDMGAYLDNTEYFTTN